MIKYDIVKLDSTNIRMTPKNGVIQDTKKELDNIIEKTKAYITNYVRPKEFFRNNAENFENKDKSINARSIALCVERDETIDGNALLLLSLLHPQLDIDASVMLTCGKKEQLLEYLNKPDFKEKLQTAIEKLSKSFE